MSKTLGEIAFITKLAGFEHTKYIQGNCSHTKIDESYIPLFIGKTVRNGKIDNEFDWYISKSISDELPRSQLNRKCLILPYVGSLGDLALFDGSYLAHLGSNIAKIEFNEDCGYLEEYIYYFLKSPYGQSLLLRDMQGAIQKNITMEAIRNVTLPDVGINEQKRMLKILMRLDQKINNNNCTNLELEAMAKDIYDYWFLQFDFPSEEGRPYKSSGGKMIWNEELKREVPEGWEIKQLRNYINVIRGVSYDKKDILTEPQEGYVPLLKANNIQNGVISYDNLVYVKKEKVSDEQMLTKNSILITMSSGSKEHMGKTAVIYDTIPYTCGAFCAKIKCSAEYRAFLSLYFRHSLFKNNIDQMSVGTNINNINIEHVYEMKIPVPPQMILKQYEDIVSIILDKQGQISKENQELICLRDFLLPLLMNGQVRCGGE